MEQIEPNPILKFNENQLQIVRKAHGYEDVNKLKQDLEILKDWIQMQNHFTVKEFDQKYLERLLICNKGSIERTKKKLDKLCRCVNLMPDLLQNFDIKNEFRPLLNTADICVLPKPTKENYRVYIARVTGVDDNDYRIVDYYKYNVMVAYYMLHNDYCHGLEMIGDTRNITMGLISKFNPVVMSKGLTLFVEGLSQRVKKIHLLSGSKFFDTVFMFVKQGLSAKLKERFIIHPNVESLYEHIPREQLPADYGGEEKSIKELVDLNFKEWSSEESIKKVKFMETIATNESLRLDNKFDEEYSGMQGSFKTLSFD